LGNEILRAEELIRPWVVQTELLASPIGGTGGLYLKLENTQHTGSFKARGALNKLLRMSPAARAGGVVTASTGNHGAAVAYAAGKLGISARIIISTAADPGKVAAIRALGGQVQAFDEDSSLAEVRARRLAEAEGVPYISPYNDLEVVAGQGTVGVELARQLPRADAVFIALGGGGLLAGVAAHLAEHWPGVTIVGCSPENSAVMIHSLRAGRILEMASQPTLSDGTAGGVEPGAITFELCRQYAGDLVTVTEAEIRQAMGLVFETHHLMVEGAAGVALAAYLRQVNRWRGKTVVVILCGGNVNPGEFEE
jgi:threonine dehydratase